MINCIYADYSREEGKVESEVEGRKERENELKIRMLCHQCNKKSPRIQWEFTVLVDDSNIYCEYRVPT